MKPRPGSAKADPKAALEAQARALQQAGRAGEALEAWSALLKLDPAHPRALGNLGMLLANLGKAREGLQATELAVRLDPGLDWARWNLVLLLDGAGQGARARGELEELLRRFPRHAQALAFRASLMAREGNLEEAVAEYGCALEADPAFRTARINRLAACVDLLRLEEARADLEVLLREDPGNLKVRWNHAALLLLEGDWEAGLEALECRWEHPVLRAALERAQAPLWDGGPLDGPLLLCAEQGLGDTLNFVRYLPLIRRRGVEVILQAQESLLGVLATQEGAGRIIGVGQAPPPHAACLTLPSAPRIFRTRPGTVPWNGPYLSVPDRVPNREGLARLLQGSGRKVGLVWAGGTLHERDRERSLDPRVLAPLAALPGIRWFSLQVGRPPAEASAALPGLVDLAPLLSDFSDTAFALQELDLLVSVDTSAAHLAGALGRPVDLLLPFCPDWRWLTKGQGTPWYPGHRLFRQARPGDWAGAVDQLLRHLVEDP